MAKELIELYAKRMQAKGYAFSPDSDWQHDFEARFAYEETEDQLRCIAGDQGAIWSAQCPWTGCCAGMWASARPRWPCARPSNA